MHIVAIKYNPFQRHFPLSVRLHHPLHLVQPIIIIRPMVHSHRIERWQCHVPMHRMHQILNSLQVEADESVDFDYVGEG